MFSCFACLALVDLCQSWRVPPASRPLFRVSPRSAGQAAYQPPTRHAPNLKKWPSPPDVVFSDSIRELCLTMATKKLVGVHRVLLLLRTSLLASVLTLEVPLPAVLAAFSLRSFFLHVCYNYDQKSNRPPWDSNLRC